MLKDIHTHMNIEIKVKEMQLRSLILKHSKLVVAKRTL